VGQATVTHGGPGNFVIDSFFDVFTEISLAGGPFQPQTGEAQRIDLRPLPEAGQLPALLVAAPLLYWMARRRRAS
jgi:hypothetical protein